MAYSHYLSISWDISGWLRETLRGLGYLLVAIALLPLFELPILVRGDRCHNRSAVFVSLSLALFWVKLCQQLLRIN